jgi:hypothetical protein
MEERTIETATSSQELGAITTLVTPGEPWRELSGNSEASFDTPVPCKAVAQQTCIDTKEQMHPSRLTSMLDLIRSASDQQMLMVVLNLGKEGKITGSIGRTVDYNGEKKAVPLMPSVLTQNLILPDKFTLPAPSARDIFQATVTLLQGHTTLAGEDCALVAYWSMATWFADYLPFFPALEVTGPALAADTLLQTLVAVCRRPILLADANPSLLSMLPVGELIPTLLIREPQISKRMAGLLRASNQPGYLVSAGKNLQSIYSPKCIYLGERIEDQIASNNLHLHVGETLRHSVAPSRDIIRDFQNQLLTYRFVAHDAVATSKFRVSGFQRETCAIAEVLGAAIVDDPELQRGIIQPLKERDEQYRGEQAGGHNGVILRALLSQCHENDGAQVYVREIAATANQIYIEEGESVKISPETVGRILKALGIYTRRLGSAGRGLLLDKITQARVHRLAYLYAALPSEPVCGHCVKMHSCTVGEASETKGPV